MVKARHFWFGKSVSGDSDCAGFIITDNAGSFANIGSVPESKYQGFFINNGGRVFRVIESLELKGAVRELRNRFYAVERVRTSIAEKFFLPHHYDSLSYRLSKGSEFDVVLDCMEAYDMRRFGRYYSIHEKSGVIVVEFVKKTDYREDGSNDTEEFRMYLAIKTNGSFERLGEWVRREYQLDRSRNTSYERYVYRALRLNASKTVFAASFNESSAISHADYVFDNQGSLENEQKAHCNHFSSPTLALYAAETALHSLITKTGIYAGLPWFFQHWCRDSLVAAPAAGRMLWKRIVLSHLSMIGNEGRLPNVDGSGVGSGLGSSDAVGWLFLRAGQLYSENAFTKDEVRKITSVLGKSLQLQQKHYGRDNLVFSKRNESWMDTSYNDNGREGFPIEVQALTLAAYSFLWLLTKSGKAKERELAMAKKVRQKFWNGSYLNDLADDSTVRPNVFIAAYAYPQLLSKKEWEKCIDNVLPRLWLDWGGLSSIDKSHPLFQPNYTGEDNRSYHRGDSWFWVNNLAAIVMARINKNKYRSYIERIKAASVNDLLWKGAIGCCSELSSASQQRAEGCLNQAWSCSTLIELLRQGQR